MEQRTIRISELQYRQLTDNEFRLIGLNIYCATELETALCHLATMLAVRDRDTPENYEAAYNKYVGSQRIIPTIREDSLHDLDPDVRKEVEDLLNEAQDLLDARHSLAHGLPRDSGDSGFLMVRKMPENKRIAGLSLGKKMKADYFDVNSLTGLATLMQRSFNRIQRATMYYWPASQGLAPFTVVRRDELTEPGEAAP